MPDARIWISALRNSHDRFAAAVQPLDDASLQGPSYDSEWSIAQVASHLGSQAEIFGMFLEAGLAGQPAPGNEQFPPVWDRWNGRPPAQQVADSLAANEKLVTRLEQLPDAERTAFALNMFGMDLDLSGLAAMRLSEHALHTWDVAVALDPGAVVPADAVELLVDGLPQTAARVGKAADGAQAVVIETAAPERSFVLTTGPDVALDPAVASEPAELHLPAEALIRLVYGRLDPDHTPPAVKDSGVLARLRRVFPGF
jgi:uncharacterized protein (TIGR03083 family)